MGVGPDLEVALDDARIEPDEGVGLDLPVEDAPHGVRLAFLVVILRDDLEEPGLGGEEDSIGLAVGLPDEVAGTGTDEVGPALGSNLPLDEAGEVLPAGRCGPEDLVSVDDVQAVVQVLLRGAGEGVGL